MGGGATGTPGKAPGQVRASTARRQGPQPPLRGLLRLSLVAWGGCKAGGARRRRYELAYCLGELAMGLRLMLGWIGD